MIQGIDVSHWEKNVDFKALLAGGWQFCFLKATEGTSLKDGLFAKYWDDCKNAGVIRGAYHFFHPDLDPLKQAEFFLSVAGSMGPGDLPAVLDLEIFNGIPSAQIVSNAQLWLYEVNKATKKMPIIYASPSFINQLGSPPAFTNYPLWVANYGVSKPHVPKIWSKWTFWQNSESGNAPGVTGHVDTNYFNGSIDELKNFCL